MIRAWNEYVRLTESRIERELSSQEGFFAYDFQVPRKAGADREALLSGKLVIAKARTRRVDGSDIEVPGAMIHHWRGAVFIPGVTLDAVLEAVQNPDVQNRWQEDVLESRVLERNGNSLRVYLKLIRSKIVTVTYSTEHLVQYRRHSPERASSRTISTKVAELANAGTSAERGKPEGEDRGFLWRLNSYWRYQEMDGGVLVECESLTLSRSIPTILAPVIGPIVRSVAEESMSRTLVSMRRRFAELRRQPTRATAARGETRVQH
ncbi:MAG: hypothetical protein ACRD1R_05815 [Acidobacteriota bacterium]